MANSVVGALRVNLGIDTAQFSEGLKSAQASLDNFGALVASSFAGVAAAATALAGALAVGVKRTIDAADDLGKMSQKFGLTVEELSRLKYVADLSGISLDSLGAGFRKLSQNMVAFANGSTGPAAQAFAALGISVANADGSMKSSSAVMTEIAGKFGLMEDGAQKTALAEALFGRSGADLIPMLNAGADGLAAMMAEADRLGIVISGSTAAAAEAFNDNLSRMATAQDAIVLKITAAMLPALERLSEELMGFVNNEAAISAAASGIVGAFGWVAREAGQVSIVVSRLNLEVSGLMQAMGRLKDGNFSGAWEAWKEGQDASAKMRDDMNATIDQVIGGTGTSQGAIQRRIDEAFGAAGGGAADKFVANFTEKAAGVGGRIKAAIDPMAREAARVFEQTRTPLESYQAEIARLNELLAAGAITQDTYNRAVLQAQDAFDKAGKGAAQTAQSVGGSINSMFSGFGSSIAGVIKGTKEWSDVLTDLLGQLAQLALSGLTGGGGSSGGGGIGGILSSLVGGLIGFKNGGSIMPGGTGGIDGQVVAFRKSPSEQVDIYKPGGDRGGSVGYAPVYNIDARGADQAAVARLERGLAERDRAFGKMVDSRMDVRQTRRTRG